MSTTQDRLTATGTRPAPMMAGGPPPGQRYASAHEFLAAGFPAWARPGWLVDKAAGVPKLEARLAEHGRVASRLAAAIDASTSADGADAAVVDAAMVAVVDSAWIVLRTLDEHAADLEAIAKSPDDERRAARARSLLRLVEPEDGHAPHRWPVEEELLIARWAAGAEPRLGGATRRTA